MAKQYTGYEHHRGTSGSLGQSCGHKHKTLKSALQCAQRNWNMMDRFTPWPKTNPGKPIRAIYEVSTGKPIKVSTAEPGTY